MKWLKCVPVFKHGYGQPEYRELESPDWVDDAKYEMRNEFGDPEGLREPKWEVLDVPPEDVLREKLKRATDDYEGAARRMARYAGEIGKHYPKEPTNA